MLSLLGLPLLAAGLLGIVFSDSDDDPDIAEETPEEPEEPITAEDLVTVTDDNGDEIPDEAVLSPAPERGYNSNYDQIVTAPDADNDIDIGFDPENRFLVHPSAGTETIDIRLNSSIRVDLDSAEMVRGDRTVTEDNQGVEVTHTIYEQEFDGAQDITLHIGQDEIGVHDAAQINLVNPDSSLQFDFEDDVSGNLHLIRFENESVTHSYSSQSIEFYVVHTSADVTEIPPDELYQIIVGLDVASGATLITSIYLGEEAYVYPADDDPDYDPSEPYSTATLDRLNEDPMITTNINWTSVSNI